MATVAVALWLLAWWAGRELRTRQAWLRRERAAQARHWAAVEPTWQVLLAKVRAGAVST